MIPMYNTKKFNDIFPDAQSFKDNYDTYQTTAGLLNLLDDTDKALTWQLLTAKYGNNPIANWSETQFKLKCWEIMFQYGPTWVKKLDIQHTLRGLTETDLLQDDKAIYNTALAPNTAPSTATLEEVQYISSQNTTNRKKNKIRAYNELLRLLENDVTEEYLDRFKKLFLIITDPRAYIYVTEDEGDE